MLSALGAMVTPVEAVFDPEPGAYGSHDAPELGHTHDPTHA
jgi:urease accessory protein UreE